MAKKRLFRYYVEPLDDHTNEVLSIRLSPRYECEDRKFWNGETRPAWEVPSRKFINFLQKSRQSLKIDFNAYIQEGDYLLQPYPWPIPKEKKSIVKRNLRGTRNSR